jgi:hypothetical protein
VLSDGVVIRGRIRDGAITLVEQQQVTDQVHVSLHGLKIVSVLVKGSVIVGCILREYGGGL